MRQMRRVKDDGRQEMAEDVRVSKVRDGISRESCEFRESCGGTGNGVEKGEKVRFVWKK